MNNTTVDALKDVYTELGGSAATVASMQTDAEVIEALSALVGSTIELPAVTSEDNGDVLTVVEGAWAKAEPATPTSELPTVTSDDNGDVLTVVEGAWAKAESGRVKTYTLTNVGGGSYELPDGLTNADVYAELQAGEEIKIRANNKYLALVAFEKSTTYVFMSVGPEAGAPSSSSIYVYRATITNTDAKGVPFSTAKIYN